MKRAAIPVLALALSAPLGAMDLQHLLCGCAEDALNRGDYVSCVAMLSPRLVASGQMTRAERTALVREASQGPPEDLDCTGVAYGSGLDRLEPMDYGMAVQADRAFYLPGDTVRADLLLWNRTGQEARFLMAMLGDRGCQWDVRIRDRRGILHQTFAPCLLATEDLVVGPGETLHHPVSLPLETLNAETGQPDGTLLEPGAYLLEATLLWSWLTGPVPTEPVARIPFRIEE